MNPADVLVRLAKGAKSPADHVKLTPAEAQALDLYPPAMRHQLLAKHRAGKLEIKPGYEDHGFLDARTHMPIRPPGANPRVPAEPVAGAVLGRKAADRLKAQTQSAKARVKAGVPGAAKRPRGASRSCLPKSLRR